MSPTAHCLASWQICRGHPRSAKRQLSTSSYSIRVWQTRRSHRVPHKPYWRTVHSETRRSSCKTFSSCLAGADEIRMNDRRLHAQRTRSGFADIGTQLRRRAYARGEASMRSQRYQTHTSGYRLPCSARRYQVQSKLAHRLRVRPAGSPNHICSSGSRGRPVLTDFSCRHPEITREHHDCCRHLTVLSYRQCFCYSLVLFAITSTLFYIDRIWAPQRRLREERHNNNTTNNHLKPRFLLRSIQETGNKNNTPPFLEKLNTSQDLTHLPGQQRAIFNAPR